MLKRQEDGKHHPLSDFNAQAGQSPCSEEAPLAARSTEGERVNGEKTRETETFCLQNLLQPELQKGRRFPKHRRPPQLYILPPVPHTHSLLTPGTELGTRPRSFLRVFTATFR